jgi:lysophospholipase L1-like esterase
MLLKMSRDRSPSRIRRDRRRLTVVVEALEVRSLMTSAAVIQWQMAPTFAPDPLRGGQLDLPNTSAYVNPANGYEVLLDATHSKGIKSTTTFVWAVTNSSGFTTFLQGAKPNIDLQQGTYTVYLEALGLRGTTKPVFTKSTVQVKDILIVSIGDSYASGEGNPVVPGYYFLTPPQWAYSPDPAMNLENANGHRSTLAGSAQFALRLQQSNPHEAVTFVSVANSGASIAQGLLGPMQSIVDPNYTLPPEIAELQQIVGTHHIDVLTVSIGGNDVGFSTRVEQLIANTYIGYPSLSTIQSEFNTALATMPGQYAALNSAIAGLNPGKVMITDYPDLSRNAQGKVSALTGPLGVTAISKADAQFASSQIIAPLDATVKAAATANGWTYVGIASAFHTHGYPSSVTWIRQFGESLQIEDSDKGTFHPNATGHQAIAKLLLGAYSPSLTRTREAR